MKNFYLVLVLFVFSTHFTLAQSCLPSGITFTTQQEIDDFATNNPSCTEIEGLVKIEESVAGNITNLNGLSNIISLENGLEIKNNSALTSLGGLDNLTTISVSSNTYGLYLGNNNVLASLTGLEGLTTINGIGDIGLSLNTNPSLTSLSGLENLTTVSGSSYGIVITGSALNSLSELSNLTVINGSLYLFSNSALTSLTGLENLTTISGGTYGLYLYNNDALTSLTGLENLTTVSGSTYGLNLNNNDALTNLTGLENLTTISGGTYGLYIYYNAQLSVCNVESICNYLNGGGSNYITGNATGCSNLTEVINACTPPPTFMLGDDIEANTSAYACSANIEVPTIMNLEDYCDQNPSWWVTTTPGIIISGDINGDGFVDINETWTLLDVPLGDHELCYHAIDNCGNETIECINIIVFDGVPPIPVCEQSKTVILTATGSVNILALEFDSGSFDNCGPVYFKVLRVNNEFVYDGGCEDLNGDDYPNTPSNDVWYDDDVFFCSEDANADVLVSMRVFDVDPGSGPVNPIRYNLGNDLYGHYNDCYSLVFVEYLCPTLTILSTQVNASCFEACNGYITIDNIVNGESPFTYAWSSGESTQTIDNLCPDDYSVTVTDAVNCEVVEFFVITEPDELFAIASSIDETCYQCEDGTAEANPTGGTPPYSYAWSNGETTQTITNLPPTTYTVTVTDDNMCVAEETVTVEEFVCPTLDMVFAYQMPTCFEECDGSITITGVTNGVEPFMYVWSNGGSTQTIDNLCAGDYAVTVTDAVNCLVMESFTITEPNELIANTSATDETANNANDGTATCAPTGGTPSYTYAWSNGETTQSIDNLVPNTYTVTVTDINTCSAEETVTVNEFVCPTLDMVFAYQMPSCFEECDGQGVVWDVINGVLPFTYAWSNGETTYIVDNLCAGDYAVTVTDNVNCEVIETFTITEPTEVIPNASATNETGNGFNDGTATSNPSGGTPSYEYEWSNGETTQSIANLTPDTYTVTVTNNYDCESIESVVVEEFVCPTLTITSTKEDATCFDLCNGSITITGVTNGVAPLTYLWSNSEITQSIDNLCDGSYSVTVTDSKNCSVSGSFTITEPTEVIPNASATSETANNANDGTATCTPTGGTPAYTFAWSNGETTQSIANLAPTTYTVTVTDANTCSASETVIVNEFVCPTFTITSTQEDATCFELCNGSIIITGVTNSVPPQSYLWSNSETTESIDNLCDGSYSVTVTDAMNCSVSESFTITEPAELTPNASSTNEQGNGFNDGTATATPSGGTPPYEYEWSNGETTQTIDNLTPNTYTVTVTDFNSCESIESVVVEEFICSTLDIEHYQEEVTCYNECNGLIEIIDVYGGTPPFTYEWSNGENGSIIDNLCAVTYGVTITDIFNCEVSAEYEITEPDELFADASATEETSNGANDGTATANPSGGTSPYYYEWSTGATTQSIGSLSPGEYTVTVIDYNDCESIETVTVNEFSCAVLDIVINQENVSCYEWCDGFLTVTEVTNGTVPFTYLWSNGANTEGINNLCSGEYSVTIVDAVNCIVEGTYIITKPLELIANATSTDETSNAANDGTATANPNGGTEPYTYSWSNGSIDQTITGLSPAAYTVTVTDANGCESIETVSVAEFGCQGLNILSTVSHNLCFGDCIGSIEITGVDGGQAPFTFTWDNGSNESNLMDLCAGTYSVTVVDGNNCSVLGSYTIETPNELTANINSTGESGNETNDGSATANPIGGTQPYTYLWSNGEATKNINGLSPDTYTVTISDASGCMVIDSATIVEFVCPVLEVETTVINASCYGNCDGIITISNVVNAVSPMVYNWSNGASTTINNNLCAGDYTVTIFDSKNCSIEQSYTITEPNEIVITVDEVVHVRVGILGSISISTNGDYTYDWKGDNNYKSTEEDIKDLEIGCYRLVVTDPATACSVDTTICVDDLTATNDLKELSVNVYPNPVDKTLIIEFKEAFDREINVSIIDLSGSQIIKQSKNGADKKLMVDTKKLDSGIYIMKLQVEGKYLYKKIVVIH